MKKRTSTKAAKAAKAAKGGVCLGGLRGPGCDRAADERPVGDKLIDGLCGACRQAIAETAADHLGLEAGASPLAQLSSKVLAAAARGELDLNEVARREVAMRGLNRRAEWVGFDEAARLAEQIPVLRGDGRRVFVTVPANEEV